MLGFGNKVFEFCWNEALNVTKLQRNLVLSSGLNPKIAGLMGSFVEIMTPLY